MGENLWELPVAPTDLFHDPEFVMLGGRQCKLSFSHEGDDDKHMTSHSLLFEGVESFKCTYGSSCSAKMIHEGYGKLVDLGKTPWLTEVLPYYLKFRLAYGRNAQPLRHLLIYFDGGPCYEFLCAGFRHSSVSEPYPAS